MMKTKFLFIFCLWLTKAFSTDYLVKVDGGTGAGTTDATAWNITKAISSYNTLVAGDRLLFKAGQVFQTSATIPVTGNAGNSSNPITYSRYGTGTNPIITGAQTITGWTAHPTIPGVFYASVDVAELQVVTVDGVLYEMGRYPKTGYLNIDSHSGRTSITSTSIGSLPFNPVNGRAVIRKARYIMDRQPITAKTGNTIIVSEPNDDYGNTNSIYELSDGNGFFIQAHPSTLTQLGDWYYDKIAKRLYVHFGGGTPSSHVVRASLVQDLFNCIGRSYIKFDNLDLREANLSVLNIQHSDHITITNCNITRGTAGIAALQGLGTALISDNTIEDIFSSAIESYESSGYTFLNNYIHRVHVYAGMGKSGELAGSGFAVTGNDLTIMNNRVVNVGYCGISFYGSSGVDLGKAGYNVRVENNFIDTFCTIKDDGGGIYCYGNQDQAYTNRAIKNNIVMHGVGNVEGAGAFLTTPYAIGIYADNYSSNLRIEGNSVFNVSGAGIFLNSVKNDTVYNNLFYNCGFTNMLIANLSGQSVTGLSVTNNKFIMPGSQPAITMEMYVPLSNINSMGNFSSNSFFRPFSTASFMRVDDRQNNGQIITDRTLSQWQTTYSKESGSSVLTVPITSAADFVPLYNFSSSATPYPITTIKRDLMGTSYNSALTLPAYSGALFIETGLPLVQPPSNTLKIYRKVKLF